MLKLGDNYVGDNVANYGAERISVTGKTFFLDGCILRGDLCPENSGFSIVLGKYCVVGEHTVVRPPLRDAGFAPVRIGDFVHIGADCVIEAVSIESGVRVGPGSCVGPLATLKACCVLREGSVVPRGATLPSYTVWSGNPARCVGVLPDSQGDVAETDARQYYLDHAV